jgi:hypothetical protein
MSKKNKRWWQWLVWLLLLPFLVAGRINEWVYRRR